MFHLYISLTKWLPFCIRCFQMYFLELKFLYFDSNFIAIWSNQQSTSIDVNNGLDPNRRRVII